MENIAIQKVRPEEVGLLQKIGRQTFFDTFSADNTAKDMKKYLEESFSLEKLSAELKDPNTVFYFAWMERKVIGYLKLNFGAAQTELKDEQALEIERIYVLKDYHGKKAGQVLFNHVLQVAEQARAAYVWLGVWEKNLRALNFYRKNGFVEFGKHLFKLGEDEQTDIMMKRSLRT